MRRLAAITLLLSFTAHAAETELVPLKIAGHAVIAEVAYTESARAQGLKYRKHVRGNHGMLFVYPDAGIPSMWMEDTSVALSVAFIDAQGVIINIADMTPFSKDSHAAAAPALYALEMQQGWFGKLGIKPGMTVEGLSLAPRGE